MPGEAGRCRRCLDLGKGAGDHHFRLIAAVFAFAHLFACDFSHGRILLIEMMNERVLKLKRYVANMEIRRQKVKSHFTSKGRLPFAGIHGPVIVQNPSPRHRCRRHATRWKQRDVDRAVCGTRRALKIAVRNGNNF
jgi:hypothetical protein